MAYSTDHPTRFVILVALMLAAAMGAVSQAQNQPLLFERGDPAARLLSDGSATEYWDLTARFESGHVFLARFVITNVGPGEHTAAATGQLVFPDGRVVPFKNGRREGSWTLSPDRLSIVIGSSELHLGDPQRRVAYDSGSRGIKIHLSFPATNASPAAEPMGAEPWIDVVQIGSPIAGTIWVSGMESPQDVRGSVTLTHAWMKSSEADLVDRHIELIGQANGLSLYVSDLLAPAGDTRRRLRLEREGRVVKELTRLDVVYGMPTGGPSQSEYPVPQRLVIQGDGLTVEVDCGRELLRNDPLDVVPQPFRWLLMLRSRPQRVWAKATFRLDLAPGATPSEDIGGEGILSLSFLHPR